MIRRAIETDRARVITLLEASRAGAGFDRPEGLTGFVFPFSPAYAERLFWRYLRAPKAMFIIHDVDGLAQGLLMAHAFEHDFGPVMVAQERVWWIDPEHRGSAAARMLNSYEEWAKNLGCKFVGMAGMGEDPVVGELYKRRGYRVAETHYLKAIG
jgi:GNAT superfamily N-acetyltransferase